MKYGDQTRFKLLLNSRGSISAANDTSSESAVGEAAAAAACLSVLETGTDDQSAQLQGTFYETK